MSNIFPDKEAVGDKSSKKICKKRGRPRKACGTEEKHASPRKYNKSMSKRRVRLAFLRAVFSVIDFIKKIFLLIRGK